MTADINNTKCDENTIKIGCVIMASGTGERFGGGKLLTPFLGVPMIRYILDTTEGLFDERIVITRNEQVECLCRESGIPVIRHGFPDKSDTVRIGLAALSSCSNVMFVPADQPLLSKETLRKLLASVKAEPGFIWRASYKDNPGAPVFFPSWAYPELLTLTGGGGNSVARRYEDLVRTVNAASAFELRDIDYKEDLAELERYARQKLPTQ